MPYIATEKPIAPVNKFFNDFLRGGLVGCVSITAVTPVMNYTNHVLNNKDFVFPVRRSFDGLVSYNASVVPMIGVSLALNTLFLNKVSQNGASEPSAAVQLCAASLSGMIAGVVGALPEGIAQAQQLSEPKPRASTVVRNIIRYNGFFALTRGVTPTMIRQGTFTLGYMGLMPLFSNKIREIIINPLLSDLFSAIVCGWIIGIATAPWNTLRFERQKNFAQQGAAQSYGQLMKRFFGPNADLNILRGWKPRVIMSGCSMFLLYKGKALYDEVAGTPGNTLLIK